MKKVIFLLALLTLLTAVAFASTSEGNRITSRKPVGKTHGNVHHTHIVVPVDHYNM